MGVTRLAVHGESIGGVAAASVARHCQASGKSEEGRKEGRKEGGADVCCMLYVICYILYIVCYILYIGVVKGITALFRIDHRDV